MCLIGLVACLSVSSIHFLNLKVMGKLLQGILGGVSGKVGNVVGSSWKGIPIIKAKPLSVANPRSAGQVAQRSKLTNAVWFSAFILSTVIKPLWDRFAQQKSGYNAFISANIDLFDAKVPSPVSDLVISNGKMAPTALTSAVASATSNTIEIDWDNDSGSGLKLATDIPFVVAVNETQENVVGMELPVTRADGASSGDVMIDMESGDVVHAYLAFRRADGTVVSDTAYSVVTVLP